jgi:hypothetical protein
MGEPLQTNNPFEWWGRAVSLDLKGETELSKGHFERSADLFFKQTCENPATARASFEYSTLMDAFGRVQSARLLKREQDYESALSIFATASEILRSTVHFGFLSAYVSSCATLETATEFGNPLDQIDGFKNAITLLEQSKLALSLRDERHPMLDRIESVIRYAVARALDAESKEGSKRGGASSNQDSVSPTQEPFADIGVKPFEKSDIESGFVPNYFPLEDWKRAILSGYIVTYIDQDSLLLANVGTNPVRVESLGRDRVSLTIEPKSTTSYKIPVESKGRIRITYVDVRTNSSYDEGCLLLL